MHRAKNATNKAAIKAAIKAASHETTQVPPTS
jgi:hypothetical protein